MTQGKKLLLIAAVIVIAVFAGVFLLIENLDGLVKTAIETFGPKATGTPVRVESVKIGLRDGRGTISGLTVANPQGFSQRAIFSLGDVTLALDTATLTADAPVIDEIRISAPALLYEIDRSGTSNVDRLKQNLTAATGSGGGQKSGNGSNGSSTRLRIRKFVVEGGKGTLDLSAVGGRSWDVKIPTITLTDLGGDRGVTPEQLAARLTAELTRSLEKAALNSGVEQAIREKLAPAVKDLEEKIGGEAGNLLKKALGE